MNTGNIWICIYIASFIVVNKAVGFGPNKLALLLYYVWSSRAGGYSNKPPQSKHGPLLSVYQS